jgi:glycosyltransferase involved in cell wall biosynthesis
VGNDRNATVKVEALIAASHLRFDGVWQRPQQLLSRFAERVPVLFVEEPFSAGEDRNATFERGAIRVLRPFRREPGEARLDAATIEGARRWLGSRRAALWLSTPMMLELASAFPGAPLIFDCMDDLASFDFAPPGMREREGELLERAGLIFTGGRSLYERRRSGGERVKLYPSGVEFERFAAARSVEPHPLFAALEGPVFGYSGVIDERLDLEIVRELAAHECQLVFVGPVVKIDPAILPRAPNVHFTGQVRYEMLPRFLAGFDVALLPFARNAATANISPTKTPEYLAAGLPVVSAPIADVVADWGDIVDVAGTPQDFVAACFAALASDPARRERGYERSRRMAWDGIAAAMWDDVQRLAATKP